MSSKALAGLENLAPKPIKGKPGPKPQERPQPPKNVEVPVQEPKEPDHVVRIPRTVPVARSKAVEELTEASTILEHTGLGAAAHTEQRREQILCWMLNGHLHGGQLMSIQELAVSLDAPLRTVQNDVATLKDKMGEFYTDEDIKDVPAMAHMLMEMKFQDRGRALALYNIIMNDINSADIEAAKSKQDMKPLKSGALTGRDRAAMYSAALTALDLSNKATNGMESLFKLTGGAQRLQTIIKAKQVTINQGAMLTVDKLQLMIADQMGALLPSVRKAYPELPEPDVLTLDADDLKVMRIADKK